MGKDLLIAPAHSTVDAMHGSHPRDEDPAAVPARLQTGATSRGLLIRVDGRDFHDTGVTRLTAALSGWLGYDDLILLPEESAPYSVGRIADQRERAIVVLPAAEVGDPSRPLHADWACRLAVATRHRVLLVPTSAMWPVRRCVAATDFGRASLVAAQGAMELLQPPAELVLAFVSQSDDGAVADLESIPRHTRLLLDALPHTLGVPDGVKTTSIVLAGQVLPALLEYAQTSGTDLLCFGRHGRSTSPGLLGSPVGATVRGLLEGSPCIALVAGAN